MSLVRFSPAVSGSSLINDMLTELSTSVLSTITKHTPYRTRPLMQEFDDHYELDLAVPALPRRILRSMSKIY